MEERGLLEEIKDLRAQVDPAYAAVRPKVDFVVELVKLRTQLGLTQKEVASRMGVPSPRVSEIEANPDTVSLDRIQAYASAMGAKFVLSLPNQPEELLSAQAAGLDVKKLVDKLRELAPLLASLDHAGSPMAVSETRAAYSAKRLPKSKR